MTILSIVSDGYLCSSPSIEVYGFDVIIEERNLNVFIEDTTLLVEIDSLDIEVFIEDNDFTIDIDKSDIGVEI